MSTLIKKLFCNHKYKQINNITLICEECGIVKKIPCCHKYGVYTKVNVRDDFGGCYSMSTLICKNCGKITKVKDI